MSSKVVRLRHAKIIRNVTSNSKGRGNDAYRVREHLTEGEIDKLLAALGDALGSAFGVAPQKPDHETYGLFGGGLADAVHEAPGNILADFAGDFLAELAEYIRCAIPSCRRQDSRTSGGTDASTSRYLDAAVAGFSTFERERDPELVNLARWLHGNEDGRPYSLREVAVVLATDVRSHRTGAASA